VFNNLLPTFENLPKIEFNSISIARWLIRLPPSGGFLEKNFIEKDFDFDFLAQKYEKIAFFEFLPPVFFLQIVAIFLY
jgi:hypothetical protein